MIINNIQGQILQRCGQYFQVLYSFTDGSIWLFSAYAMLIISISFWSRAKAKDSYSIRMTICESFSAKVLCIMKSFTIDFCSTDK